VPYRHVRGAVTIGGQWCVDEAEPHLTNADLDDLYDEASQAECEAVEEGEDVETDDDMAEAELTIVGT